MDLNKASMVIALTLFLTSVSFNMIPAIVQASPIMSTFRVEPPTSTGNVGDTITLAVNVYDAEDLWGWQIYMTWDPTVIGFTDLTFGDFLAGQPEGTSQMKQIDYVSDGWFMCTDITWGAYLGVTADSGWLMSVDFEVLAIGETTIDIDSEYTYWENSTLGVYGDEAGEMIKESGYFNTNEGTGTIAGTVTDVSTGLPIVGASVAADGYLDTSAADGTYSIPDVPIGDYTVTASAPGYAAHDKPASVVADTTTTVDFALEPVPPDVVTKLYVDPSIVYAVPGESFTIDINVADVVRLHCWQVNMSFNPNVLKFIDVTEGDFLRKGGRETAGFSLLDHVEEGWALFSWAIFGKFSVSGSGVLATVEFQVLTIGESELDLVTEPIWIDKDADGIQDPDEWIVMTYLIKMNPSPVPPGGEEMEDIPFTAEDGFFTNMLTLIYIDPSIVTANPGDYFTINVSITDVTDVYGWQFKLRWESGLLEVDVENITEGAFLKQGGATGFAKKSYTNYINVGCTLLGATSGVDGSGTLATVTFKVLGVGSSDLELYDTKLLDSSLTEISHTSQDGYFYTTLPTASFFYSPTEPQVDETVTFDASASYDRDGTIVSYEWDFGDGTTGIGMIVTHRYTTPGIYTVALTVADNDGLTTTATAVVTVKGAVHDVAVTHVEVYPTRVISGQYVNIGVWVANEGTANETFDVTVYYDTSLIDTSTVWNLSSGASYWLWFSWNTAGVAEGNYTISVEASIVPGETDTADNTYINGIVTISVPRITITPNSGPTGTKVTVRGSGFPTGMSGYLMFDDELIGFIFADMHGSFNATFNVPLSEAGQHTVKTVLSFYPYPLTLEETFTVIDTTPLDVATDVGAIYFKGETAEFHVQTSFKGVSVDVTSIDVTLYKPDGTVENLTAQTIATGLYKIDYSIKGKGSMLGTYTLVVEANYSSNTVNATGTSLKTFLVKSPWREWEHEAPKVALSAATIAAAFASVVVWRRENQKLKL